MDWQAVGLTLRLAGVTTFLLMSLGLPLAWWLSRGDGSGRAIIQAIVGLPLLLPPTVLGFYLLVDLGPQTGAGRLLIRVFGHPLAFSFTGLVIGSMLYSAPFAVQPMVAGFRAVGRDYEEVARTLGASSWRIFWGISLPLAQRTLVTAAVLCFTHTVGEFGVVLMLGGNIPGATRTMSIALYDQVQDGRYQEANTTAGALMLLAFLALAVLYRRKEEEEMGADRV